jgi:acetyl-CoA carboxylase carboxyltransferase component
MGPEGAVKIIYKREIENSEDPQKTLEILIDQYKEKFTNPYYVASLGYIDDVIEPSKTRRVLIMALKITKNKRQTLPPKKHDNIPL